MVAVVHKRFTLQRELCESGPRSWWRSGSSRHDYTHSLTGVERVSCPTNMGCSGRTLKFLDFRCCYLSKRVIAWYAPKLCPFCKGANKFDEQPICALVAQTRNLRSRSSSRCVCGWMSRTSNTFTDSQESRTVHSTSCQIYSVTSVFCCVSTLSQAPNQSLEALLKWGNISLLYVRLPSSSMPTARSILLYFFKKFQTVQAFFSGTALEHFSE